MSSLAFKSPELIQGPTELVQEDFEFFRKLIHEVAGIRMNPSKRDLVQTRLRSRLQALRMGTFSDYRTYLQGLPEEHEEWQTFVNLLTTNKTDFFREPKHFEFLAEKLVPEWAAASNEKVLKIWCAASSTGEEPYTLAMVLRSCLPADRDFHVYASDIDTKVLAIAQNGVYPLAKASEIPREFQGDLTFGTAEIRDWFRMRPYLKEKITFGRHNLIENVAPAEGPFDAVFCRNVMIYFGKDTIAGVAKKLASCTKPSGHLFIGHSESLQGISTDWKQRQPSVYRKSRP